MRARFLVVFVTLLLFPAVAPAAGPEGRCLGGNTLKQPDKLIILSTTDVKGKTGPCG